MRECSVQRTRQSPPENNAPGLPEEKQMMTMKSKSQARELFLLTAKPKKLCDTETLAWAVRKGERWSSFTLPIHSSLGAPPQKHAPGDDGNRPNCSGKTLNSLKLIKSSCKPPTAYGSNTET